MCIILARFAATPDKPLARLDPAHLAESAKRNPDGFGVMWAQDGVLNVRKYMPADADAFRQQVLALDALDVTYVAHARIKTHGPVNLDLAHPFTYTQPDGVTVGVAHNGIIDIATTPSESDTQVFVRDVLARLPAYWWRDGALRYLVSEAIGWSKLTVLTSTGESAIINESSGTWDGGIWRSNTTYKAYPTYTVRTTPGMPAAQPVKASAPATRRTSRQERAAAKRAAKQEARAAKRAAHSPSLTVVHPLSASVSDLLARPAAGRASHNGHSIVLFADIDRTRDGEYMDSVACDTCRTVGDAYCIDGTMFYDLSHRAPDALPF